MTEKQEEIKENLKDIKFQSNNIISEKHSCVKLEFSGCFRLGMVESYS